jgi:AraC family transcriptional regulator of adaptative response / methylphosphotriester-DNA alkyltransferase methyltransferase
MKPDSPCHFGRCKPTQTVTDELYETMIRRDTKFDGKWYIGIVSTGIVCFPSCRSRLPKRENVRVFATLEDALRAGFRPCKRCKPDHPLGQSPDAEVANRVMEIIECRFHESLTLNALADELNMSPYHLQRTFKRFTGVSPAAELQRVRLQRAKERLETTDVPIRDIARRVGYQSASHFSATFRKAFGVSPNDYRSALKNESVRRQRRPNCSAEERHHA